MKAWKRRFQDWWMSTDSKPKGKVEKRLIEKMTRMDLKRDMQKRIKECDQLPELELNYAGQGLLGWDKKKQFEAVDFVPIQHCDHESCSLGQLQWGCPFCCRIVVDCQGWYDYHEFKKIDLKCLHCRTPFTVKFEDGEWMVHNKMEREDENNARND